MDNNGEESNLITTDTFTTDDGCDTRMNEDFYNEMNSIAHTMQFPSTATMHATKTLQQQRQNIENYFDACPPLFDDVTQGMHSTYDFLVHDEEQLIDQRTPPSEHHKKYVFQQNDIQGRKLERRYIARSRISLGKFNKMLQSLTERRIEAIEESGFGGLLDLAGVSLHNELILSLIDAFDAERCLLEIDGRTHHITTNDFSVMMGVPEGDDQIRLSGDYKAIIDVRQRLCHESAEGRLVVRLRKVENDLLSSNDSGEDFVRRFILFAVGTLLATTSTYDSNVNYLFALMDIPSIRKKRWASFFYQKMIDGIKKYKIGKQKPHLMISGCTLFLQIYYLRTVLTNGPISCTSLRNIGITDNHTQQHLVNLINNNVWCLCVMKKEKTPSHVICNKQEKNVVRGKGLECHVGLEKVVQDLHSMVEQLRSQNVEIINDIRETRAELNFIRDANETLHLAVMELMCNVKVDSANKVEMKLPNPPNKIEEVPRCERMINPPNKIEEIPRCQRMIQSENIVVVVSDIEEGNRSVTNDICSTKYPEDEEQATKVTPNDIFWRMTKPTVHLDIEEGGHVIYEKEKIDHGCTSTKRKTLDLDCSINSPDTFGHYFS